jgi:hypothetical protein
MVQPNQTISDAHNYQFYQFSKSWLQNILCDGATYLRPDASGSILPWPYTLCWLIIHLPTVIIRVMRWEKAQTLSLVLALISVAWSIQAYKSTGLTPEHVLVWMPVTLLLDVGAVMQVFWLVVEDAGFRPLVDALVRSVRTTVPGGGVGSGQEMRETEEDPRLHRSSEASQEESLHNPSSKVQRPGRKAFVALSAVLLLIALVILQLIGLSKAIIGRRKQNLQAKWCAPIFQAFAIAVGDGNCNIYPLFSEGKSLSCISLPATYQKAWLCGTVVLLSLSIVFEVFDMLILALVRSNHRWRGAKMRRPWFSIFTGLLILVILLLFGVYTASTLPGEITKKVVIFRVEPSLGGMTVCQAALTPAGVRGSILGWSDGFFNDWNQTYYGLQG